MSTDEVLRTILILSISLSLLMVAIQLARLLGTMRGVIKDNKSAVKDIVENTTDISNFLKQDYDTVRRISGIATIPTKTVKALFDLGIMGTVFDVVFKRNKKKPTEKLK